MAKLTDADIAAIAKLARIELNKQDRDTMTGEVGSVLQFVESLQSIDTAGVEPTSQVTGLKDVWRADKVRPSRLSREKLLAGAPEVIDGYVKVKKVL